MILALLLAQAAPVAPPPRIVVPAPPAPYAVPRGFEAPTGSARCKALLAEGGELTFDLAYAHDGKTQSFVLSNAAGGSVPNASGGATIMRSGAFGPGFGLMFLVRNQDEGLRFSLAFTQGTDSRVLPLLIHRHRLSSGAASSGSNDRLSHGLGYCWVQGPAK